MIANKISSVGIKHKSVSRPILRMRYKLLMYFSSTKIDFKFLVISRVKIYSPNSHQISDGTDIWRWTTRRTIYSIHKTNVELTVNHHFKKKSNLEYYLYCFHGSSSLTIGKPTQIARFFEWFTVKHAGPIAIVIVRTNIINLIIHRNTLEWKSKNILSTDEHCPVLFVFFWGRQRLCCPWFYWPGAR